jgi:hypothetical protein
MNYRPQPHRPALPKIWHPGLWALMLSWTSLLTLAGPAVSTASGALTWDQRIASGHTFLTNLLDPALDLLPEYSGAKVYWLYHDNYLAAKLLEGPRTDLARRIRSARRATVRPVRARSRFWLAKPRPACPFALTSCPT